MLLVSVNLLLNMFIAINVKTCSVDHECVAISSFIAGTRLAISVSSSDMERSEQGRTNAPFFHSLPTLSFS